MVGAQHVPEAKVLALEVGFHAESPREADNVSVIAALVSRRSQWREVLGDEAEAGGFLGRAEHWHRLSETWADPDLGVPELVFELAARLADYVIALEPVLASIAPGGSLPAVSRPARRGSGPPGPPGGPPAAAPV